MTFCIIEAQQRYDLFEALTVWQIAGSMYKPFCLVQCGFLHILISNF